MNQQVVNKTSYLRSGFGHEPGVFGDVFHDSEVGSHRFAHSGDEAKFGDQHDSNRLLLARSFRLH